MEDADRGLELVLKGEYHDSTIGNDFADNWPVFAGISSDLRDTSSSTNRQRSSFRAEDTVERERYHILKGGRIFRLVILGDSSTGSSLVSWYT